MISQWQQTPWVWAIVASTAYWTWMSRPHDLSRGDMSWVLIGSVQLGIFSAAATHVLTWLAKQCNMKIDTAMAMGLGGLGLGAVLLATRSIYPNHGMPCETGLAHMCPVSRSLLR